MIHPNCALSCIGVSGSHQTRFSRISSWVGGEAFEYMEHTPSRLGLLSRSLSTSGFPGDRKGLPVVYGINRVTHRVREMLSDHSDQSDQ